ncbi:AraC family transcriptional regulator [Actinoplanes capillaceus]|uniref:AraC family transcriptional regulator n=2 Tax=Actinoplanes campanulatus TaxID=113559 RepID=A0ABQ3WSI1_9ACTN|nr:AraC family transcriptional regulator [Actinoplanes capillaceus]
MWERYNEPLSLDMMANSAFLSRFYFSRLFRATTGTSPARFLAAIRLYQAKTQLRETAYTVTDIAYNVGYNSLGTFISRFTRSVGVSPARYRSLAQAGMPRLPRENTGAEPGGMICGRLELPAEAAISRVYVGVFRTSIVEGVPLACHVVDGDGFFMLPGVPAGQWFLRAAAVSQQADASPGTGRMQAKAVAAHDNVRVVAGATIKVDLTLHTVSDFDLPILIALPELDSLAPRSSRKRAPRLETRLAG